MLDQLLSIVRQYSGDAVINNPEVPNEQNNEVMAEATKTIASGLQNVMAGGGLQNILDLFKGNNGNQGATQQQGIGGLLKNPIVTMMVGYFISKLVGKYNMSPAAASNIANKVIPNALNGLIQKTRDPNEPGFTLDGLVASLTGGDSTGQGGSGGLQDILERFTGGGSNGNGFDLQDIIGKVTQQAQQGMETRRQGGGGIMDLLKGLMNG